MQMSSGYRWLIGVPVILLGLGLELAALDVVTFGRPASPRSALFHGPNHWQLVVFGIMFISSGVNLILPERYKRTRHVLSAIIVLALLIGLGGVWFVAAQK